MEYRIREIQKQEYPLLEDFLYEAIFVPEGAAVPPRTITAAPQLRIYVENFGESQGDLGLVAEIDKRIVGAVWCRIMDDYGRENNLLPSV